MRNWIRELRTHRSAVLAFLAFWAVIWAAIAVTWDYGMPGPMFILHLFLPALLAGAFAGAWRRLDAIEVGWSACLRGAALAGAAVNAANFLLMLAWGGLWLAFNPLPSPSGAGETWFSFLIELPFWIGLYLLPGLAAGLIGGLLGGSLAGKIRVSDRTPRPL